MSPAKVFDPKKALAYPPVAQGLWEESAGQVAVSRASPNILVVTMRGRVELPAGDIIRNALQRESSRQPSHTYWDLWELEWYHSEVRNRSTAALVEGVQKKTILEIHCVAQSKLVNMGVTVANIALGGRIQLHADDRAFAAALAKAARSLPR